MTKSKSLLLALTLGFLMGPTHISQANTKNTTDEVRPDNSAVNADEANHAQMTAEQQGSSKSDTELARQIRKDIMSDKDLSLYAHNIKIIATNGVVTLKGPVRSETELRTVNRIAAGVAGSKNVKNEIQIASK